MTAEEVEAFLGGFPADKRPKYSQDVARELVAAKRLTKFQAQAVYQGKTKSLVLDNYVILEKIGAGGMGQVFKAEHRRMQRVVALKVLTSTAMKSPEAVQRFQREVIAAAKLSHPNIVTAHDAGESGGIHFLVMEHVDGADLSSLVKKRGPLPVAEAVDYIRQAAEGLEYAHRQGVIHRDIKPSNLLLDANGTVKILDMGLARLEAAAGESDGLTQSGQVMGTADYMPPEQVDDTRSADRRADIYSLGCTLYRLLAAKSPYSGSTFVQVVMSHRDKPIPSLQDVSPDVSDQLNSVFQKMLAKRPEDRQQSMAEVIADLDTCSRPVGSRVAALLDEPSDENSLWNFLEEELAAGEPVKEQTSPAPGSTVPSRAAARSRGGPVRRSSHSSGDGVNTRLLAVAGAGVVLCLIMLALFLPSDGDDADPGPSDVASTEPELEPVGPRPTTTPKPKPAASDVRSTLPLITKDDFESGAHRWKPNNPALWKTTATPTGTVYDLFACTNPSGPGPTDATVWKHLSLLDDVVVGDMVLTVKVKSTADRKVGSPYYNNQDVCVFFGYQDPANHYFVHFGRKPGPSACNICRISGGEKEVITDFQGTGADWDDNWHNLKIVRSVATGEITAYFDDMQNPLLTANDKTFTRGQVGLSAWDDTAQWDDFQLHGTLENATAKSSLTTEPGFVSLFDGRSLDGWQGATESYAVEDGNLVWIEKGRGVLLTNSEYDNFALRFDVKLTSGANNGVVIRAPGGEIAAADYLEVQIIDDTASNYDRLNAAQRHGSLYGLAAASTGYLKPVGQWNTQEIVCDGRQLTVTLNGTNILDVDLDTLTDASSSGKPHPGLKRTTGHVGLLAHDSRVEFRNLRIKRLPRH